MSPWPFACCQMKNHEIILAFDVRLSDWTDGSARLFVATGACIHKKGRWTSVALGTEGGGSQSPWLSVTWVTMKLDQFPFLSIFGPDVLFSTKLKWNCSVSEVFHLKLCAFAEWNKTKTNVTTHIPVIYHIPVWVHTCTYLTWGPFPCWTKKRRMGENPHVADCSSDGEWSEGLSSIIFSWWTAPPAVKLIALLFPPSGCI